MDSPYTAADVRGGSETTWKAQWAWRERKKEGTPSHMLLLNVTVMDECELVVLGKS